jgi:hypothetical protein
VLEERAKLRANDHRREESSNRIQPLSSQLDALSSSSGLRLATAKTRLTSEGSLVRTQLRPQAGLHVQPGVFTFGFEGRRLAAAA